MKNESLYKKYLKDKKVTEKYNIERKEIVIEKSNLGLKVLSLLFDVISKIVKVLGYILLVILCSLGATFLFNNILHIKIF